MPLKKTSHRPQRNNRNRNDEYGWKFAICTICTIGIIVMFIAAWIYLDPNGSSETETEAETKVTDNEGTKFPDSDPDPAPDPDPDPDPDPVTWNIRFDPNDFLNLKAQLEIIFNPETVKIPDIHLYVRNSNPASPLEITRTITTTITTTKEVPIPTAPGNNEDPPKNGAEASKDEHSNLEETQDKPGEKTENETQQNSGDQDNTLAIPQTETKTHTEIFTTTSLKELFEGLKDSDNPGISGKETFEISLDPSTGINGGDYEFLIQIDNPKLTHNSPLPQKLIFPIETIETISSSKSVHDLRLNAGEFTFEKCSFHEVNLTKFNTINNLKNKTYAEWNGDLDIIGEPLRDVQTIFCRDSGNKTSWRIIPSSPTLLIDGSWLPRVKNYDAFLSIIDNKANKIQLPDDGWWGKGENKFVIEKTIVHEEIDAVIKQQVLNSINFVTKEPIEKINQRLRYVMDEKRQVTGFYLEQLNPNQTDYYPISLKQVKEMKDRNELIAFWPVSMKFRIRLVDGVKNTNIQNITFDIDTNALNDSGKPMQSIRNKISDTQGYSFTIDFSKPSQNTSKWQNSKVFAKSNEHEQLKLSLNELGLPTKDIPTKALKPIPRNIVILIPQSESFKNVFEEYWSEEKFQIIEIDGSTDPITGKKLYPWKGEDGELGLVPRFVETLKNTLKQNLTKDSVQEDLSNTEIDIYIVNSNEGLIEYGPRKDVNWSKTSLNWGDFLSGGQAEAFNKLSHRFGPRTTVVALLGGAETDKNDIYYNLEDKNIKHMHVILFSDSNDEKLHKNSIEFCINNSDTSHIVGEPTKVEVITKRASEIALDIFKHLRDN